MARYRSWSGLNKRLEGRLCESLKGRITYFLTRYHSVHNAYGRAAIRLDGSELVRFSWVERYEQENVFCWSYPQNEADWEKLRAEWNESGKLHDEDFIEAALTELDSPVSEALESPEYLVRIFAVLDKRTGKRTLRRLLEGGEYLELPQWVRQFYELRFEAEGMLRHDIPQEDPQKTAPEYVIRKASLSDAEDIIRSESLCFPPNEAEKPENVLARLNAAPELFTVCECEGKLAGFICGIPTSEEAFRDEFFTNAALYEPEGRNVILLSLEVLPEFRGRGIARRLMAAYAEEARQIGRERLILTCHDELIDYYRSMGFVLRGKANSAWGGGTWNEMGMELTAGR